jgi:hypothetical protein
MKRWILAGALALATAGFVFVDGRVAMAAGSESRALNINIAQIKNALKLSAAQLPLWARVEAALQSIAREQAEEGLLHKIGRKAASIVYDDAAIERLKSAAMPLLASLNDEQKATARRLAQQMGFGEMLAMLN